MNIERQIKSSLGVVEMDHGDIMEVAMRNGRTVKIELLGTSAAITDSTLKVPRQGERKGRTNFRFHCDLLFNGSPLRIEREVSSRNSFYEPVTVDGLQIWFDAAVAIFEFLYEKHGPCRPEKAARFAFQESGLSVAPDKVHPWCPLPPGGLRIEDCYNGEDCWLGAFSGVDAHGGLDINHPAGTPLYAPFDLDDQYLYQRVANGDYNNRWRGFRRWADGTQWVIHSSHMLKMNVEDHQGVKAGAQYAEGAGVAVHAPGSHEHSHFAFGIVEGEKIIWLDPWILFRQMYLDQKGE